MGGTGSPGRRARRHRSIRSRPSGRSLRARRRSARSRPSGRTQATRRSARRHRCLVSSCGSRRQKASKRLFNGSSDHQALDSASGGQGLSPRSPANIYFVPSVCVVSSCRFMSVSALGSWGLRSVPGRVLLYILCHADRVMCGQYACGRSLRSTSAAQMRTESRLSS